jgi:serine/threonine protein kinase
VIGDVIGKGGAATVHKGLNIDTRELIAVKKFRKGEMSGDQLKAVTTELDLLSGLQHPNIVSVKGFVEDKANIYLILEYVDSGSLLSLMKQYTSFPPLLVGEFVAQVLQGLDYLHKKGIVHRDIKAANLLITKEGEVKLADFGAAAKLKDETEKRYSIVGTPYWMAPEVVQAAGTTSASDIWSLGCTVIELLTGHPPYWEHDQMHAVFLMVKDEMPPLPDNLPSDLVDFLHRCFVKDPTQRASAEALSDHIWVKNCASAKMSFKTVKSQLKVITKTRRAEEPVESQQQDAEASLEHSTNNGNTDAAENGTSNTNGNKSAWEAAVPRPQSPASQRPEDLDPNVFVRISPAPTAPEVAPPLEVKPEPVSAPVENSPTSNTSGGQSAGTQEHVIAIDTKSPVKLRAKETTPLRGEGGTSVGCCIVM